MKNLHWSLYAALWLAGITALGAVLGALSFPLAGWLFGREESVRELAVFGARTLGFYFLIWAPGIALVLTVKRAYETRRRRDDGEA